MRTNEAKENWESLQQQDYWKQREMRKGKERYQPALAPESLEYPAGWDFQNIPSPLFFTRIRSISISRNKAAKADFGKDSYSHLIGGIPKYAKKKKSL